MNRRISLRNEKSSGELISGYVYGLKTDGNRESVEELHTNRLVSYTYDRLNRLTEERIADPAEGISVISYNYDSFGNRLTKTDSSGTVSYAYDDNDRLLTAGDVSYTYDSNGNTKTKTDSTGTVTYGYDYENRLVSVQNPGSTAEYAYDADGIRVSSVANGAVTNYAVDKNRDYAQVLEERDGAGSLTVSYVYGDDLISQNRSGPVSYYHYDGLGSTRLLTDVSANVTDTYTYKAFGGLIEHIGNTENIYLFTGEQYDPSAGFYYLRARYYDPNAGRFATSDPWKGNIYKPASLHKYLYANANPVINIDPSGFMTLLELTFGQNAQEEQRRNEANSGRIAKKWMERKVWQIIMAKEPINHPGFPKWFPKWHYFPVAWSKASNRGLKYDIGFYYTDTIENATGILKSGGVLPGFLGVKHISIKPKGIQYAELNTFQFIQWTLCPYGQSRHFGKL